MRERIAGIRDRIRYRGGKFAEIGCVLVVQPTFFSQDRWVAPPRDWPARTQVDKRYDLLAGEGARVWRECLAAASREPRPEPGTSVAEAEKPRNGTPQLVTPRLGQGVFRVAVTDAYQRACAVTGEHPLPALEAARIRPFADDGPHDVRNGVLLRADIHRLLDQGYATITREYRFEVSRRLEQEFENGRSYYPRHGGRLVLPSQVEERPAVAFIEGHNQHVYLG